MLQLVCYGLGVTPFGLECSKCSLFIVHGSWGRPCFVVKESVMPVDSPESQDPHRLKRGKESEGWWVHRSSTPAHENEGISRVKFKADTCENNCFVYLWKPMENSIVILYVTPIIQWKQIFIWKHHHPFIWKIPVERISLHSVSVVILQESICIVDRVEDRHMHLLSICQVSPEPEVLS